MSVMTFHEPYPQDATTGLLAAPQTLRALADDIEKQLEDQFQLSTDDRARWIGTAVQIVDTFAHAPFTSQQEMLTKVGATQDELHHLNALLRSSDLAQQAITSMGTGAKYWQNTILPLIDSGAVKDVLSNRFRLPYRIGIYPGVSCMFFCSFCGRNHGSKYNSKNVHSGNRFFQEMFQSLGHEDPYRFYISGGLEPLTNPAIGDLIRDGAKQGHRLSMYTNGYMLTPRLLEKQDGFWDLNLVRVSLYGVDHHTTEHVTQNRKAFQQVKSNIKSLLQLRNARQSPLKIGLNYVILPNQVEQVLELMELIGEINREAGGNRPIDFLTLREDYSAVGADALSDSERAQLADLFAKLEERRQQDDLRALHIDYGYGLNAMRMGTVGELAFVDHTMMRPKAYPQISVVVDLLGDVYLYREAGFLHRAGAERYKIGRLSASQTLDDIVRQYISEHRFVAPQPGDTAYMDSFDHAVTKLLNQADMDRQFGMPFAAGPVRGRVKNPTGKRPPTVLK